MINKCVIFEIKNQFFQGCLPSSRQNSCRKSFLMQSVNLDKCTSTSSYRSYVNLENYNLEQYANILFLQQQQHKGTGTQCRLDISIMLSEVHNEVHPRALQHVITGDKSRDRALSCRTLNPIQGHFIYNMATSLMGFKCCNQMSLPD